MTSRFYCFTNWDEMNPNCLLHCPDRYSCIRRYRDKLAAEALLSAFLEKKTLAAEPKTASVSPERNMD